MVDRQKVIGDLEEQIAWIRDNDFYKFPGWGHVVLVMRDALALLKAQDPRVVTLDDYENNPNVDKDGNLAVWRESRHFPGIAYHEDGWVVLNRNRVEGWFNSEAIRFWTSRPTDEQREAVKWE